MNNEVTIGADNIISPIIEGTAARNANLIDLSSVFEYASISFFENTLIKLEVSQLKLQFEYS